MQERLPGRKCRRRRGLRHSQECPGGSNVPKSIPSQTIVIKVYEETDVLFQVVSIRKVYKTIEYSTTY